ncbi:MAG TPA: RsiV family protein, partial [Bacteroidales bacterium]
TEESRPMIEDLILKKIMLKHKVQKAEDLEEIGFFDVTDINLNKNFYITKKGIVYTFNEYEIAAYALGTIEIMLSYEEISAFMIPGNPLVPLIQ